MPDGSVTVVACATTGLAVAVAWDDGAAAGVLLPPPAMPMTTKSRTSAPSPARVQRM
jgi:hypothetical protein